ncbi:hypothetical protein VZG28_06585 [Synechococcus elongatus IITB4]|uniref:hypothetical protein n=1 Tax=Synechococcus elongatus TaxID=32046 RepID=UPI0030D4DC2C
MDQQGIKRLWQGIAVFLLAIALIGCRADPSASLLDAQPLRASRLKEVPPPALIADLSRSLDQYQPQVKILSPKPDQVIESDRVEVKLQVRDYPLFLNEQWQMGPHLHLILDNEPYQAIYDVSQPIELTDLQPGTHTLRVFASRPWHESFKNEGAYAQVSFSVFTPTESDRPNLNQPLLTYSRPKGSYGAEPVMLDFYLTNAPLHSLAQADDEIEDWQIRITVNGESFRTEDWQPIYLEGLKPGRNWVKLELLDERGQPRSGPLNTTVRLIDYQPDGQAVLDRLVRGELDRREILGIVDRNYVPPTPEPEPAIAEPEELPAVPDRTPETAEPSIVPNQDSEPSAEAVTESMTEPVVEDEAADDAENAAIAPPVAEEDSSDTAEAEPIEGPEPATEPVDLSADREAVDTALPRNAATPEAIEDSEQSEEDLFDFYD